MAAWPSLRSTASPVAAGGNAVPFVLAIDAAPVLGIGALATALVTVTGYMLFNSRDSDRRVDDAQAEIGKVLRDQRDEARSERDRARAETEQVRADAAKERQHAEQQRRNLREELARVYDERNDALERVRILQLRLGGHTEEGT